MSQRCEVRGGKTTTVAFVDYTLDAVGNAFDAFDNSISMTVGTDTATYSHDGADRLTSLTSPGESAITYTWDAASAGTTKAGS